MLDQRFEKISILAILLITSNNLSLNLDYFLNRSQAMSFNLYVNYIRLKFSSGNGSMHMYQSEAVHFLWVYSFVLNAVSHDSR